MNPTNLFLTVIPFHLLVFSFGATVLALWKKPEWWPYALAVFSGLLTGFIDLRSGEIQLPALLLLAFSFFLGFARPASAWLWGLVIGVWVPIAMFVRLAVDGTPAQLAGVILPFAFSFAGSFLGSFLRRSSPSRYSDIGAP